MSCIFSDTHHEWCLSRRLTASGEKVHLHIGGVQSKGYVSMKFYLIGPSPIWATNQVFADWYDIIYSLKYEILYKPRQHCRLSICSYFGWLWKILNLGRAGLSIQTFYLKTNSYFNVFSTASVSTQTDSVPHCRLLTGWYIVWKEAFTVCRSTGAMSHSCKLYSLWGFMWNDSVF